MAFFSSLPMCVACLLSLARGLGRLGVSSGTPAWFCRASVRSWPPCFAPFPRKGRSSNLQLPGLFLRIFMTVFCFVLFCSLFLPKWGYREHIEKKNLAKDKNCTILTMFKFSGIKHIHIIVQPSLPSLPITVFILQNWPSVPIKHSSSLRPIPVPAPYSPSLWTWLLQGCEGNHTVFVLLCLPIARSIMSSGSLRVVAGVRYVFTLRLNNIPLCA